MLDDGNRRGEPGRPQGSGPTCWTMQSIGRNELRPLHDYLGAVGEGLAYWGER